MANEACIVDENDKKFLKKADVIILLANNINVKSIQQNKIEII